MSSTANDTGNVEFSSGIDHSVGPEVYGICACTFF